MGIKKSYEEINARIRAGHAVVVTAEEVIEITKEKGVKAATQYVDVVTTGTFGPMFVRCLPQLRPCQPPIKMSQILLNNVHAYGA